MLALITFIAGLILGFFIAGALQVSSKASEDDALDSGSTSYSSDD